MEEKINSVIFDESKVMYISLIIVFHLMTAGVVFFGDIMGIGIFAGIGLYFLSLFEIMIISTKFYKIEFHASNYAFLILAIIAFIFSYQEAMDKFLVPFIIFTGNVFLIIMVMPISSIVYTTEATFIPAICQLQIKYNKLFGVSTQVFDLPTGAIIELQSVINPGLIKQNMMHSIIVQEMRIYLASINANSFQFVNKVISLFDPIPVKIDTITKGSAQIVLQKVNNKIQLTVPKFGIVDGYNDINLLEKITNLPTFKKTGPLNNIMIYIRSLFITIIALGTPMITIYLFYLSLSNKSEKAPIEAILYLSAINIFLLIVGINFVIKVVTVSFGKLEPELNQNYIQLKYKFWRLKPVTISFHRSMNPKLRVNGKTISLVLLDDFANPFYSHKIGKVDDFASTNIFT